MNARKVGALTAGAVGVGATILGVVVAQPAIARDQALTAAPVLARVQTPADVLPEELLAERLGTGGLLQSSTRLLGSDDSTTFWIALDASTNVCLVAQSRTDGELSAATCPSPDAFAKRGAWLQVQSQPWTFQARLDPAGSVASLPAGWERVAEGLFVSDIPDESGESK